jgi:hypothetical protein
MARGRTAAFAVALIALIAVLAACSSGISSADRAARDRRAAAANRAAAVRNRALVARRRAVAARRRARIAARHPSAATTGRGPTSAPRTPTTIQTQASTTSAGDDLAAIRRTIGALNAAFHSGVASGISKSATSNFWVGDGSYTGNQCASFETARSLGVVSERIALHADSLVPAPGWVDPVIGRVPRGRIYRVAIDETQTLVPTGQQRARTLSIHVAVGPDGRAGLFLRCH